MRDMPPSTSLAWVDLRSDCRGIADEERALWAGHFVELRAGRLRPAALRRVFTDHLRPAGEEDIACVVIAVRREAHGMNGHLQRGGIVAGARSRSPIEVNERTEPLEGAADDCDHQRQSVG
jgi:hypothetical protein